MISTETLQICQRFHCFGHNVCSHLFQLFEPSFSDLIGSFGWPLGIRSNFLLRWWGVGCGAASGVTVCELVAEDEGCGTVAMVDLIERGFSLFCCWPIHVSKNFGVRLPSYSCLLVASYMIPIYPWRLITLALWPLSPAPTVCTSRILSTRKYRYRRTGRFPCRKGPSCAYHGLHNHQRTAEDWHQYEGGLVDHVWRQVQACRDSHVQFWDSVGIMLQVPWPFIC